MPSRIALLLIFACVATAGRGAPGDSQIDQATPLILDAAPSPSDRPVAADPSHGEPRPTWTAQQVRDWAAAESPAANLLEAEWRAVGSLFDRNDMVECTQARLIQSVLRPLAAHQRNLSAAEALRVYYRIVGIEQQRTVLSPAIETLDGLIDLADRAEELELPDGNPNALRRRQLELQSQDIEARFGIKQLRVQLAELTGRPRSEALTAELVDPLVVPSSLQEPSDAVRDALSNRQDLRAIETLCRQINSNTLPAVRQLFAGLQPGLGMAAASTSGGKFSLLSLHASQPDVGDLACRRQQCYLLQERRRSQVESEVYVAAFDLAGLVERIELARQRAELAETAFRESERAVELDQMPLGTDRQRQLEWLEIRGEYVQRLMDTVLADVQLREARGAAASE